MIQHTQAAALSCNTSQDATNTLGTERKQQAVRVFFNKISVIRPFVAVASRRQQ